LRCGRLSFKDIFEADQQCMMSGGIVTTNLYDPRLPFPARIEHFSSQIRDPATKAIYAKAMTSVDWPRIERIRAEHAADFANYNPQSKTKYLDIPYWTYRRLIDIKRLNIRKGARLHVLDLGCGCAHIGLLLSAMGHSYAGTDIHDTLYAEICEALGVRRIEHTVKHGELLPDFGGPFDLVLALDVCFNWYYADSGFAAGKRHFRYWTPADWTAFMNDLAKQMTQHSKFYFAPNMQHDENGVYLHDPQVVENFVRLGTKPMKYPESLIVDLPRALFLARIEGRAPGFREVFAGWLDWAAGRTKFLNRAAEI
jgi:hypothetical protein